MRVLQAPTGPLPELAQFLQPFHVHFVRSEGPAALERYLTGLLTGRPTRTATPSPRSSPAPPSNISRVLTEMVWDEDDLNRQRVRRMLALPTEGNAVLIFDDTGFAKQGRCSVGVQRQYSGTLGKRGNCQISVNCHYAEKTVAWPVAMRLYLPQQWANDPARRAKAHVPEGVTFQTKPAIALALLDRARELGIPHACVTADADYGDNPNFLDGLDIRKERHVVAVRCDFAVAVERGAVPQRADAVVAAQGKRSGGPSTGAREQGLAGWAVRDGPLLAGAGGWHAADRLADRGG